MQKKLYIYIYIFFLQFCIPALSRLGAFTNVKALEKLTVPHLVKKNFLVISDFRHKVSDNFGTNCRSHLQGSWTLKMGPIGRPETSARNYHYSLLNNPEERFFKKFSAYFRIRRYFSLFSTGRHLPFPEPDQTNPCPRLISCISSLMVSSYIPVGVPSNPFSSRFPLKTVCVRLLSSTRAIRTADIILRTF